MQSLTADTMVLLGAGLIAAAGLYVVMYRWPKVSWVIWLCGIGFVPVWIGMTAKVFFPAIVLISILVILSWLPHLQRIRFTAIDMILLIVLVLVAAEYALHLTTRSFLFVMFTTWLSAYLVGRLVIRVVPKDWVYAAIAVVFTVVAALAVIEFVTSVNLFITYVPASNAEFQAWGTLQPRGDVIRAEGAFGHSIALGASLAIAIGLTLGSRIRTWLRLAMIGVMLAGVVVSFSRAGMVTAALAIVLIVVFQRSGLSRRVRISVVGLIAVAAIVVEGFVSQVFAESGSAAQDSADYRGDLLSLVQSMQPFGLTDSFAKSTTDAASIGAFGSIDDAALLFGLSYGWVPLALAALCLVAAITVTLRRTGTSASITFVAMIPAFVTVAFITQYASMVWFLAGLAVATQAAAREDAAASSRPTSQALRTAFRP